MSIFLDIKVVDGSKIPVDILEAGLFSHYGDHMNSWCQHWHTSWRRTEKIQTLSEWLIQNGCESNSQVIIYYLW